MRAVVRGRRGQLVVERERPDGRDRQQRRRRRSASATGDGADAAEARRLRARTSQQRSDQGNCTTTSCGSAGPHRYNSVILLVPLRDPSNHHRSGFRLAVHPTDRAAPARAVGVLGGLAAGHADREDSRAQAGRHHPVGRAEERVGRRRAEMRSRRSSTLGRPVLGICYGMQLMARSRSAAASRRRRSASSGTPYGRRVDRRPAGRRAARSGRAVRRRARRDSRLGQPRRLRRRRAGRLLRRRDQRQRAGRRDGRHRARALRAAVSPGSRAHRARPRDPPQLRLRRLRLHRRLDDGVVCRGGDGAGARAGRRRARRLRAERRRRLDGRGAHHPPRGRRPADLHLRRQRRAAARRGGADPQALRAAAAAAGLRRRVDAVSRSARRRHRSGEEAQDHRRDVHRRVRGGGGEARPGRLSRAGHAVSRRHRVDRRSSASRR